MGWNVAKMFNAGMENDSLLKKLSTLHEILQGRWLTSTMPELQWRDAELVNVAGQTLKSVKYYCPR